MNQHVVMKLASVAFLGAALAVLSPISAARADCPEINGGTCKSHKACDASDSTKHCRDTLKSDGYHCECRAGKDNKSGGPDINIGLGLGLGHGGVEIGVGSHGVGIDIGTGGFCDHWGCPDDYWDDPVFYGSVYYDGEWYDGPVYYRRHHGEYQYWIHGGWHEDEWDGPRPDWARDSEYGDALGHDYYESDEFRHGDHDWHHRHHGDHHGDEHGDHHGDHDGDHHDGDHHNGDHHDGDHKGDKGDNHHDGDQGKGDHQHGDKDKGDKDKGDHHHGDHQGDNKHGDDHHDHDHGG